VSNPYSYRSVQFENVERWTRSDPGRADLEKTIGGVNGALTIRMGSRPGPMSIEGFISDANPDAFFATVRALVDGVLGTFTPGHGSAVENVKLEGIQSLGAASYPGGYWERYRVTFRVMK